MFITARKNASNVEESKKMGRSTSSTLYSADGMILCTFLLITCIKILLIPTYHSTDFEVHRNWLAITHNLPIKEWYISAKSEWTLDYPPLFAWFEYLLSQVAVLFDPEMLKIENLNYASSETIYFQRATVICTDLMFVYGVREMSKVFCKSSNSSFIFIFLSLCNMGLLVVDHIHFQYNGFLLGSLLLSIAKISDTQKEISMLQGAALFCILLNLKHIYLYVAPAYVVWLLKSYCMKNGLIIKRLFILGTIVLTTLIVSFGPFISQLQQVLSRLFPFKRGLVHAYWAANGWALYIGVDKVLSIIWKYLGWLSSSKPAIMTGGLVQEQSFVILPTPTPAVTFVLTALAMSPALWCLYNKREITVDPKYFVKCIVLCSLSSFMFGWHVHEKAILTAVIPLCVLAVTDANDARVFLILSSAGHTALLPLLYEENLTPLKLLLLLNYTLSSILTLSYQFKQSLLYFYEWAYVGMLPAITIYETLLHKLLFAERLPFLPLALTSIYCAIGITYSWCLFYYMFLTDSCSNSNDKKRSRKRDPSLPKHKKRKVL